MIDFLSQPASPQVQRAAQLLVAKVYAATAADVQAAPNEPVFSVTINGKVHGPFPLDLVQDGAP